MLFDHIIEVWNNIVRVRQDGLYFLRIKHVILYRLLIMDIIQKMFNTLKIKTTKLCEQTR